jgi:hypothetical protein
MTPLHLSHNQLSTLPSTGGDWCFLTFSLNVTSLGELQFTTLSTGKRATKETLVRCLFVVAVHHWSTFWSFHKSVIPPFA